METLARYFGAFDKICERIELTRIKTIGDSYMAAAGIPAASADHARDTVAAGLAIRDYIAAENSARVALGEPAWDIRTGRAWFRGTLSAACRHQSRTREI